MSQTSIDIQQTSVRRFGARRIQITRKQAS